MKCWVDPQFVFLSLLSCFSGAATIVRALEIQARARVDLAEIIRTSAKESNSFSKANEAFAEAAHAYSILPTSARCGNSRCS